MTNPSQSFTLTTLLIELSCLTTNNHPFVSWRPNSQADSFKAISVMNEMMVLLALIFARGMHARLVWRVSQLGGRQHGVSLANPATSKGNICKVSPTACEGGNGTWHSNLQPFFVFQSFWGLVDVGGKGWMTGVNKDVGGCGFWCSKCKIFMRAFRNVFLLV